MASGILREALAAVLGRENANELCVRPAAEVSLVDAGGFTAATTAEAAFAELYQNAKSAFGFIELKLEDFRKITTNDISASGAADGGVLSFDTAPKLIRINAATDKGERILWAASSSVEIATTFMYPPDLDESVAFTVNLRCKMSGAIDTPTVAIGVWEGIGGGDIGTAATAALSSTLATKAAPVTPGSPYPQFAAVTITPGAHTTDALELYRVWILYKKRVLAS